MKPLVCAHRGASQVCPENSQKAIEKALEMSADAVEIDIRATSDGVPVLMHDKRLKRVAGLDRKISEVDLAQFKQIRLNNSEPPAILEDILAEFGHKTEIILDIKTSGLENKLIEMIRRQDISGTVIVSAFNPKIIKRFRIEIPDIRTALILGKHALLPLTANFTFYLEHLKKRTEVDFLHLEYSPKYMEAYSSLHAKGIDISYWTVNRAEDIEEVQKLEPYSIMTDYPDRARAIIDS
ncbi:MAG: hypothetical protein GF404_01870 [candidate division Zixibacteria bacterium]|nr:hypothetical protein [candidate division Zixibacteria bacterium]